jgi:hypothetical protein
VSESPLSALQVRMTLALREGGALERYPHWVELANEEVAGNARLSAVEQLEIYREQFWLRHTSSLVEDFPGLGGIVGQAAWEKLAEAYLLGTTPDSYTLRDLGKGLPQVVERADWLPERELCVDMARLEWAYVEAFDASDTTHLNPERLASIPEHELPNARLVLAPCVRLLQVSYPVADLRRALQAAPDQPVAIPAREPQNLLIYRKDLRLWDMKLSAVAFRLLTELARGTPLGRAAELAGDVPEAEAEIAENIGAWFQEWTRKGLVCDVVVAQSPQ